MVRGFFLKHIIFELIFFPEVIILSVLLPVLFFSLSTKNDNVLAEGKKLCNWSNGRLSKKGLFAVNDHLHYN